MKTYLFDTINRYKRFSENLDVKTTLCNKSWWVFNDSGAKSIYIFQENGDLYITTNGIGIKGSWQYVTANQTVIINSENAVMMFHPSFIDNNILALTLDGTNDCAFLIDENNKEHFTPNCLSDLANYFQDKEKEALREKERKSREREEEERERKEEVEWKGKANTLREEISRRTNWFIRNYYIIGGIIGVVALIFVINVISHSPSMNYATASSLVVICIVLWIIVFIILTLIHDFAVSKKVKKWKEEHPNDPRNKYL